jgi:D-tagatose-1,6-bisphosphate aldolase subunit GatZ/KbaZ
MKDTHILKQIVKEQKLGIHTGIYSICSANKFVIQAVMERAIKEETEVLIEATANQVNQYGGYTGMKPADFRDFVYSIARQLNFPKERIILGGDHLGPLTWKNENSEIAMDKSKELIREYVLAGFTKIHIDTSMHLADDDHRLSLDTKVIAERSAILCAAAEEANSQMKKTDKSAVNPVYVIGSEVPIPGGSQEEEDSLQVTKVSDFNHTVEVFKQAFSKYNLNDAWENVIAVVVQPGVEFGDEMVHEYDPQSAKALSMALKSYPNLVFEGHSTDYQNAESLKQMVEDGIAILKVGPALTFAVREALFALNNIENEVFKWKEDAKLSGFSEILDQAMLKNPENWKKHYHGDSGKISFSRKYSLSDRCRYYLTDPEVVNSIDILIKNLKSIDIPLTIISQYMPIQFKKIRKGLIEKDPEALIKDRVDNLLDDYQFAVNSRKEVNL